MASPAKKAPQKFGTQVQKSPVIYVFRNGDKHHKGEKITLKAGKSMEQFLQDLNQKVGVVTGSVRQVFTAEGKLVKKLEDIEDGAKYVCAGAEKFDTENVPTKALGEAEEAAPKEEKPAPVTPKKKEATVTAYKHGVEKFGTQSEKAKVIYVFRNSDKNHQGVKMTVHPTKFKTFDQLKVAMSTAVQLPTGPVRQVFTPEGKLIKGLEEFVDEAKYVCAGAEKFNKELLATAIFEAPKEEAPPQEEAAPAEPAEKKVVVNAYKKGVEKFGTQSEKGRVITVFRNGDKNHQGQPMTIHPTKFKTFDQLKEGMTKQVGLPTGPVLKVYTSDGKMIKGLDEFEDGGRYICAGAEKFNKDAIPSAIFEQPKEEKEEQPAPPTPKKTTPAVKAAPAEKFGTQSEKAKNILVFRNGDKNHEGAKMAVHIKKYKNMDQLKEAMSKQVGVPTGPVRQVFTVEGKLIKSLDEFEDEGRYVCAGAEKFNKALLPPGAKAKPAAKPAASNQNDAPVKESKEEAPVEETPQSATKQEKESEPAPQSSRPQSARKEPEATQPARPQSARKEEKEPQPARPQSARKEPEAPQSARPQSARKEEKEPQPARPQSAKKEPEAPHPAKESPKEHHHEPQHEQKAPSETPRKAEEPQEAAPSVPSEEGAKEIDETY